MFDPSTAEAAAAAAAAVGSNISLFALNCEAKKEKKGFVLNLQSQTRAQPVFFLFLRKPVWTLDN